MHGSLIILLTAAAIQQARGPLLTDPERECRAAIAFLEKVDECDRPYIRFTSLYALQQGDDGELREFEVLQRFTFRQLTLSPNRRVFPTPVPNSFLWSFDLRSFGWNDAAWRAVALRDKSFREPQVSFPTAQRLRRLIGERQPHNFHVVAIVDGFSLYRRVYQTTETPDYYDLLFAEQRFPATGQYESRELLRYWPGGRWTDGHVYPADWFSYLTPFVRRGFKDFPANQDEWLSAFLGGIKSKDYNAALVNLKARRGAVVKGMEDARTNVSFVARNNRLLWMAPGLTRFSAVYGETFDQNKTAGKRDVAENAFTDQGRDQRLVTRDGGELLISLPSGQGLAALLINAVGKRVEEVPGVIAIHTRDHRDRRVRGGAMLCLGCHGDAYGWIPFPNVIENDTPDKINVHFRDKFRHADKQAAEDYDSFFIGWQDDLKPIREQTKKAWLELTGTRQENYADGWTGTEIGQISLKWHHRALDPVDLDQAARELGVGVEYVRLACMQSPLRNAADLFRGSPVPRAAWDEDLFPHLMVLLHSRKDRIR